MRSRGSVGGKKMKSVCIAFAVGCPRSKADTGKLFKYFEANGWELRDRFEDADLVLVATCGVSVESEDISVKLLAAADKDRRKGSRLIVVGCLAGINQARLLETFDVDSVPPSSLERLDALIGARVPLKDIADENRLEPIIARAGKLFSEFDDSGKRRSDGLFGRMLSKVRMRQVLQAFGLKRPDAPKLEPEGSVFTVRIASGCTGECSYCAIRIACGPLRSKPLDRVLAEFDAGLTEGYTEFSIVAQDIGPYGTDIGTDVVQLVGGLFGRPGNFRLTFLDLDPKHYILHSRELRPLFARHSGRVRLLMMPVQSGSERMLGLMRRGHSAKDARECLRELRISAPGLTLATHILVGFPGETDEDFEQTVDFLRAVQFDRVDVYSYGDRPNTDSSLMPDKVPSRVKKARTSRLRKEFKVASW